MEKLSFFDKLNLKIKNSITIKLIVIGILFLIMLIPVSMIESIIREREYRRSEAISEVCSKWGNEQTIAGPILSIPYKSFYKIKEGKEEKNVAQIKYAHFLPEILNTDVLIKPEIRYRGIFEAAVYKSEINLSGKFNNPDFSEWEVSDKDILWNDAFISIGVSDMRGIKNYVNMSWNGDTLSFNPGIETNDVLASGISAKFPVKNKKLIYDFSVNIELNGSQKIYCAPLGKETTVKMNSNWNSPSFDGAYLPDKRNIGENGFDAEWKILHLNRNYPQKWLNNTFNVSESEFGTKLLIPVDHYSKTMRSIKYASMFISLTFLMFFFVEILNKKRIHPIQYILAGLALCIFFTLLLSISEHINFNLTYFISSLTIIAVITGYARTIFKQNKLTFFLFGILLILYGFIFTVLQLEDYALLLGSLGLLIIISAVMYLSRKINWYDLENSEIKNN
ncbi:MAG TPA: cell envelope integrity protein CreD [bacterium]|nr:cell envelope integrity protein CreD [bacterium]HPN29379.1 cell envelope integrity protein CreD [bacterium]